MPCLTTHAVTSRDSRRASDLKMHLCHPSPELRDFDCLLLSPLHQLLSLHHYIFTHRSPSKPKNGTSPDHHAEPSFHQSPLVTVSPIHYSFAPRIRSPGHSGNRTRGQAQRDRLTSRNQRYEPTPELPNAIFTVSFRPTPVEARQLHGTVDILSVHTSLEGFWSSSEDQNRRLSVPERPSG